MKTVKEKWDKLLCWVNHDWRMDGHIRESGVENTYIYNRECVREGCGRKQTISICALGDLGNYHFLEKEWTEKKK